MTADKKQEVPAAVKGIIEFSTYSLGLLIFGAIFLAVANVPAKMRENAAISEKNAITQAANQVQPCLDCLGTVVAAKKLATGESVGSGQ